MSSKSNSNQYMVDKITVVNHKNNSSCNARAWEDLDVCKFNQIDAVLEYNESVAKSIASHTSRA